MTAARDRTWTWARVFGGAAVLAFLVWRLGTGPFLDAFHKIDTRSLVAATVLTGLTTLCCAWRWSLVARGLGVEISMREAVPAYYRSQFLNSTLPGGVVGDVHRAVRHGRDVGDVGRAARAVAWERTAGQVVQAVLTLIVLLALPSPVRSSMPVIATAAIAAALGAIVVGRLLPRRGPSLSARIVRGSAADLRDGLLAQRAWPGIVLASVLVVLGHVAIFLIAARTAGSTASPARMLPLAMLVLLAMAVPLNIAGWGPREGVAAWTFGLAGLGSAEGVAAAVVYGVMALVASLPGAVVLVATWWLHRSPARLTDPHRHGPAAVAGAKGAVRG
ncbi:MAG: hypothetical protein JWR83_2107 [Aeromicrobium sp.]|nr:hypothetical protein [Aeromicrobium sp.]